MPHWVIHEPNNSEKPIGEIKDNHSVVFFNFRGDRAIEISRAFVEEDFKGFKRKRWPKLVYAGMMEYDGDTHMPPKFLVNLPSIEKTVSEYLAKNKISQYAISETQKFGHVTYFWNGNNSEKFDPELEQWVEIPSDKIEFDKKPEMKAKEIADTLVEAIKSGKYKFLRVNFANGDMVGHTGSLSAAIKAVQAVDEALGRLINTIDEVKGTIIVTADHGNCEQMIAVDKKTGKPISKGKGQFEPMVSHTLNPVPFVIHGPDTDRYKINDKVKQPGLANVAATILTLLGFQKPEDYEDSIIIVE